MIHRQLCKNAALWLLNQNDIDLVNYELKVYTGIADALGIDSSGKNKRICIVECKVSRADLLQDLRAQKMLKYQSTASHCYLAVTPEAVLNKADTEIIKDLTKLGLPSKWGILIWRNDRIESIRPATRLRTPTPAECARLTIKIAKNYMYQDLM